MLCQRLESDSVPLVQDADDTAKMLEKEGTDAVLLAEDLSQGEQVCKKIVDEVGWCRHRGQRRSCVP